MKYHADTRACNLKSVHFRARILQRTIGSYHKGGQSYAEVKALNAWKANALLPSNDSSSMLFEHDENGDPLPKPSDAGNLDIKKADFDRV